MNVEVKLTTEDIVRATQGLLINGDMSIPFRGISTDTRIIQPGFLFWALKGKNFDGHTFWKTALDRGAKGLVLAYFPEGFKIEEIPKTISVILVKDTLKALGDLGNFWRKKLKFQVIGITGSCGKTTTKELTFSILSLYFKTSKNLGNYNNLIGVPLSILSFKEDTEVAVLEVGTNAPGEIERLAQIIEPQISVLTCVYPAHLEGLGSVEGVLEEKIKLFEYTSSSGTLIYNYDQPMVRERTKLFSQRKISFGFNPEADFSISKVEVEESKIKAQVRYQGNIYPLEIPNFGKHYLLNLLAGLAVASCFELDLKEILENLGKKISLYSRIKVYKATDFWVIDDTYNANPGSMKTALEFLLTLDVKEMKKVAILGDMKELGSYAKEFHREIGKKAGEVVEEAYFVGEMAEEYAKGFSLSKKPFKVYSEVEALLKDLERELKFEKAVILIKGSRALKMERVVEKLLSEKS